MAATPAAAPAEKVSIVFEGPWAFAPDPKDASKILLIAPKTKSHHDLDVSASNSVTLSAGVYDLSVPVSGTPGAPTTSPDFAEAKTTAADLQRVVDTKSERYVIRLPKPEAYLAAQRFPSRVGPTYPPPASTEKEYVTEVSLRYSVSSFNGFSLSGTPNSGSFNPTLMKIEAGMVTFDISPAEAFNPTEKCHLHARRAFRDLTQLLKLTLYIDFPDSPGSCHDSDPQKPKAAENLQPSRSEVLQSLLRGDPIQVQKASLIPEIAPAHFMFAIRPAFCTGAIIKLTTS